MIIYRIYKNTHNLISVDLENIVFLVVHNFPNVDHYHSDNENFLMILVENFLKKSINLNKNESN